MYIFSIVSELGCGEFGFVWLAEATGISAFHPREILREREGGQKFSSFWRNVIKTNYINSRQVTRVAVKGLKGLNCITRLIQLEKGRINTLNIIDLKPSTVHRMTFCTV